MSFLSPSAAAQGDNFYGKLRDNVLVHLAEMVSLHTIRPLILGTVPCTVDCVLSTDTELSARDRVDSLYVVFGEWLVTKAEGERVRDQIAFQLGIRGVHLLSSVIVSIVHMPLSAIVTKVPEPLPLSSEGPAHRLHMSTAKSTPGYVRGSVGLRQEDVADAGDQRLLPEPAPLPPRQQPARHAVAAVGASPQRTAKRTRL